MMAARLLASACCCCCCLLLLLCSARPAAASAASGKPQEDRLAAHMQRLYERYSRGGRGRSSSGQEGAANTVRSFRARLEFVARKPLYCFNLTSVPDSELILAATFHFFLDKCSRHHQALCKCSREAACHLHHLPQVLWFTLIFHGLGENSGSERLQENFTVFSRKREAWQAKDISHFIKQAKQDGDRLFCAALDTGDKYHSVSEEAVSPLPYILLYANDLAITEPNSVSLSLQRYGPFPSAEKDPNILSSASMDIRTRRDTYPSRAVQSNELPKVFQHATMYNKHNLWQNTYSSLKSKSSIKDQRRKGQPNTGMLTKSQILKFDEKTMKKARQKQRNEPTVCSRRYMKVDFADIGWNEWIISPKSFDAYYCAGACEFPMPKVVQPSNHATFQSILKAVGIVPGIPEPCCVPSVMNPLSVLFLDESQNVVLKVYPNMSIHSCACR